MKILKKIFASIFILAASNVYGLDLNEALISAYNNNPQLIAGRESLKATDERLYKALATFYPNISFSRTISRTRSNRDNSSGRTSEILDNERKNKSYQNKFTLNQNLFAGGAGLFEIEKAKNIVLNARANLISKEHDILFKTVNAYTNLIFRKKALMVSKENISSTLKHYQATKEKFAAGIAIRADVALSESKYQEAKSDEINAQNEYIAALAEFAKITMLEGEDIIDVKAQLQLPSNIDEAIALAEKINPNIIAAKTKEGVAGADVKLSASKFMPKVNLQLALSKDGNTLSGDIGSIKDFRLRNPKTTSKSAVVQMEIPLYQAGTEYSGAREARANHLAARSELKDIKNQVHNNVTKIWSKYKNSEAALEARLKAEESQRIALESMEQRYDEGHESLTDLLEVRSHYFRRRTERLFAEKNIIDAKYELRAAIGNLTAKDLELNTKYYDEKKNYNLLKFKIIGF